MLIEQHPVAERPGESCGNLPPLANRRTQTGDMLFPDGDYRYGIARLQERGSGVAGVVLRGPVKLSVSVRPSLPSDASLPRQ